MFRLGPITETNFRLLVTKFVGKNVEVKVSQVGSSWIAKVVGRKETIIYTPKANSVEFKYSLIRK
jgi:hypothetical protein